MQETNQQLEMITIPKLQLEQLKMRIRHLENYIKVLQEDSNTENSISLTQTTNLYLTKQRYEQNTPNKNQKTMQHCPHCHGIKKKQHRKAIITPQHLKQQLKQWSKNFNSSLSKSVKLEAEGIKEQDSKQQQKSGIIQQICQEEPLRQSRLYQPRLIQSICLFGPQEETFANQVQRNFVSTSKLIYPEPKKYEVYGNYFFPEDIHVKRIRSEKVITQVNRIIFKKTSKKQDTSVFLFQGEEGHPLLEQQEYDLLEFTNPGHKLYAFSIHFSDIIALLIKATSPQLPDQKDENTLNASTALTPKTQKNIRLQDIHSVEYGSLTDIENINSSHVYLSKFCLTIFTYFPLVNLMQDILISILEQIKIKRLQAFTKNKEQTSKIDIYYVAQQLQSISRKLFKQMESFYPNISNTGTLAIGQIMIDVDLSHDAIRRYMYEGWAYQMLRMLNKQLFYDILINFILEQSLCFVCQDLHFLTYFMLLFCDFIIRPLVYPHPCISVVFEQELLGTPFIVAIGINKDNKWLQQNNDLIAQNKIILSLNDKITVKSKKKLKVVRSQPLKDIVRQFYKDIETLSDISYTFKTAKRQSFIKPCSEAEDKLIIKFISQLQKYFNEQISKHLPNKQIIQVMQAETDKSNLSEQTFNIIKTVEKYYIESRRKKQKDAFLEKFIKQQIFYVFVCKKYKLN